MVNNLAAGERYTVELLPFGRRLSVAAGAVLSTVLAEAGFFAGRTLCDGAGRCGSCAVNLISGGSRKRVKSCQVRVWTDCVVEIPSGERILVLGAIGAEAVADVAADIPCCRRLQFSLQPPDTASSLWNRLQAAEPRTGGGGLRLTVRSLRQLAGLDIAHDTVSAVAYDGELLSVHPARAGEKICGIAIDLGSTTLAGYLYDLKTQTLLAAAAAENPQVKAGSDLISRIQRTVAETDGLGEMTRLIRKGLSDLVESLLQKSSADRTDVYDVVVAGNTCMQQLLFGIPVCGLAQSPYLPATTAPLSCDAAELGLNLHRFAKTYALPCIGGFVGGDTTAMLEACLSPASGDEPKVILAIDIGTNCEIVVDAPGFRMACSAAAGPAFEGGSIFQGMSAVDGAIDRVRMTGDVEVRVLGGGPALGICGSGLVDAVAVLLHAGILDANGRMLSRQEVEKSGLDRRLQDRLIEVDGVQAFVLSGAPGERDGQVVLTQLDVRQLQLAKAAIHTAVRIMLKRAGLAPGDVDRVLLAGAFGNYIDIANATRIGVIPSIPTDRIHAVGNAAGAGASRVLLSSAARRRAEVLARTTTCLSLADQADFQETFLSSLSF